MEPYINKAKSDNKVINKKKYKWITDNYQLYLLILPALLAIIIFDYLPIYGLQITFKNFKTSLGIIGSPWVGFEHFQRFFNLHNFWRLIGNTLGLRVYQLVAGFPLPIVLAIMINEVKNRKFKRSVQMVTYAPHFISVVVMSGMIIMFLNYERGMINHIVDFFGGPRIDYMTKSEWFKTIFVFSGIWQNAGWGTIIYLAALSGIDPQLEESARMDGANKLQKIWHIDLPGIAPTIIILLILNMGKIFTVGFQKVLLLQNPLNMESADVIQTYVYRIGLLGGQFSFSSAIGLFNSILNFTLLVFVNYLSKRVSETSLW